MILVPPRNAQFSYEIIIDESFELIRNWCFTVNFSWRSEGVHH